MTATKAASTIYRVFPLEEALREALRTARETRDETTVNFVKSAVDEQLPQLIQGLQSLGFGKHATKLRPARLPFSEETLQALRTASHDVQVPASQLLSLVLTAATLAVNATPTKRRRGPNRKKAASSGKAKK